MERQNLHQLLIERFAEGAHDEEEGRDAGPCDQHLSQYQIRRFIKMVAHRKQQMLERILIEEE